MSIQDHEESFGKWADGQVSMTEPNQNPEPAEAKLYEDGVWAIPLSFEDIKQEGDQIQFLEAWVPSLIGNGMKIGPTTKCYRRPVSAPARQPEGGEWTAAVIEGSSPSPATHTPVSGQACPACEGKNITIQFLLDYCGDFLSSSVIADAKAALKLTCSCQPAKQEAEIARLKAYICDLEKAVYTHVEPPAKQEWSSCAIGSSVIEVWKQLCAGPVWDGNLASKEGRDALVRSGMAKREPGGMNALVIPGQKWISLDPAQGGRLPTEADADQEDEKIVVMNERRHITTRTWKRAIAEAWPYWLPLPRFSPLPEPDEKQDPFIYDPPEPKLPTDEVWNPIKQAWGPVSMRFDDFDEELYYRRLRPVSAKAALASRSGLITSSKP